VEVKELVGRCITGEGSAWNEFVKQYRPHVYQNVLCKLYKMGAYSLRNEAEDIVQEIFITLWKKNNLSMLRDIRYLKAWLAKVAINTAINYCRKRFKITDKTKSLNDRLSDDSDSTLESVIPCNKYNAEKAFERAELDDFLKKEIDALAFKKQQALKLCIYDCVKQREVAVIMDLPQNTAGTLIRRAKIQVREAMERNYGRETVKAYSA